MQRKNGIKIICLPMSLAVGNYNSTHTRMLRLYVIHNMELKIVIATNSREIN